MPYSSPISVIHESWINFPCCVFSFIHSYKFTNPQTSNTLYTVVYLNYNKHINQVIVFRYFIYNASQQDSIYLDLTIVTIVHVWCIARFNSGSSLTIFDNRCSWYVVNYQPLIIITFPQHHFDGGGVLHQKKYRFFQFFNIFIIWYVDGDKW